MRNYLFIFSAMLLSFSARSENLIKNGDFDETGRQECRIDHASRKHVTLVPFTENLTWNKCMRMEVKKILTTKDGYKRVAAGILIGGSGNVSGFPVKPNTSYVFSLELKGTAKIAILKAVEWDSKGKRRDLATSLKGAVGVPEEWQNFKGSFKTTADAKFAALNITLFSSTKHTAMTYKPGDYLLIDKVSVQKQANPLDLIGKHNQDVSSKEIKIHKIGIVSEQKTAKSLDDIDWSKAELNGDFYELKKGDKPDAKTDFRIVAGKDAFFLNVNCYEDMNNLRGKISGNGFNVWKDDVIEVFFAPQDKEQSQFVISPKGGRWLGGDGAKEIKAYDQWKAIVSKHNNLWNVKLEIPYNLIGIKNKDISRKIGFNIGRSRVAAKELSTWSRLPNQTFQDRSNFGFILCGTKIQYVSKVIKELDKEVDSLTDGKEKEGIKSKLSELSKIESFTDFLVAAARIEEQIKYAKAGSRPFVVTQISPTTVPSVPMVPAGITNPLESVKIRAAINEEVNLPLAITNLTNELEEYRILVYSKLNRNIETYGLTGFPPEKITQLRGIRVKDGETKVHEQRFDPLVKMDNSYTVTAPPKDSALVWLKFNCEDVNPGNYKGFIRIIPLNQRGKFVRSKGHADGNAWEFKGAMVDIPINLEIMPIKLSKAPAIPLNMSRWAINETFFKAMIDAGIRRFMIHPKHLHKIAFGADGSLVKDSVQEFEEQLQKHLQWAKKCGVEKEIKFRIGQSCYIVFTRLLEANCPVKITEGSPEWKRAFSQYIRLIARIMHKYKVNPHDYCIEVWNEAGITKEHSPELINQTYKIAKEASPESMTMVFIAATSFPIKELEKWNDVDLWIFYGGLFKKDEYKEFIKKLRMKNKKIGFYYCGTSFNQDLYKYYRRHAWGGWLNDCYELMMFWWIDGPQGCYGASCFKGGFYGGVAYRSMNDFITSLRLECLKIGNTDIKYLAKLKELAETAQSRHIAPALVKEAEQLLAEGPRNVIYKRGYDPSYPDKIRSQTVTLILKLQKTLDEK